MSYDLIVMAPTTGDPLTHVAAQELLPGSPTATRIASAISAHFDAGKDEDVPFGVPVEVGGDTVVVMASFPQAEEARSVAIHAAFPAGYAVHDPQISLTFRPKDALPGSMTSSRHGQLPMVFPEVIDSMVEALGIRDYLIVERGDQLYVQTRRIADTGFDVEYRAGAADQHFAVMVAGRHQGRICLV